ncbi:unnamed protein product [Debaryomyces tyrocola]|nr:unnamed protein product [Debaryomyces tyrocola]
MNRGEGLRLRTVYQANILELEKRIEDKSKIRKENYPPEEAEE